MHPKPKQVNDRGYYDESERPRSKVFNDVFLNILNKQKHEIHGEGSFLWERGKKEQLTTEWPRLISRRFQRSTTTAVPTAMKANNPTILQEIVRDKKTPVNNIQVHQGRVNSLYETTRGTSVNGALSGVARGRSGQRTSNGVCKIEYRRRMRDTWTRRVVHRGGSIEFVWYVRYLWVVRVHKYDHNRLLLLKPATHRTTLN